MSKKLTTYVHADGKVYKPGDPVPKSVTNPKTWGEGAAEATEETGGDVDYSKQKVDDLKAEIAARNEGRDDDAKVSDEGKKDDLVAALEADDAAGA